jgi:hypothetical protein
MFDWMTSQISVDVAEFHGLLQDLMSKEIDNANINNADEAHEIN